MEPHLFECRLAWTGAAHGPTLDYASYVRVYRVDFAGKPSIVGSAAAAFRGDAALHNPEDLLMAALASCHCLSYLALAARAKIAVIAYEDTATGRMERKDGAIRFVDVLLRPRVTLAANSAGDIERAVTLHAKAHAECFIASSVSFPVRNEPTVVLAG
jgi:organic hydroperoxide reductase OsmC/OhrA